MNSLKEMETGTLPEELMRLGKQSSAILYYEVPPPRNRTRMTRIRRIFTDTVNPCVSVSSVQSVFYRNPAIDDNNKPQMNADERRWILATGFGEITHRKGRKERKAAQQQESLRPLRSLRLDLFFAPAHERAPPAPAVHARLSGAGG